MSNHDFILKSGAKLHITEAPFEPCVALMEAVKSTARGNDPSLDLTDVVISEPKVRAALYGVMAFAVYDTYPVGPNLFDDPKVGSKARTDYFEICARLIEVNIKPFFLRTSSESKEQPAPTTNAQGST